VRKIRALIVDDAVVTRRLVSDCLGDDPELEVVGTAPNGKIALAKIPQVNPDVVILDVDMPGMSGLETLVEIRKTRPRLVVIMFSTLTERGAVTTLDALACGANDYVTKPTSIGGVTIALQRVREQLIPRIKALCARSSPELKPKLVSSLTATRLRSIVPAPKKERVDLIAIGASTGGPNALTRVIAALPHDLSVPVVIVQHMPPLFTRLLATRLDAQAQIGVSEAVAGDALRPAHVWIAPGDQHMVVACSGEEPHIGLHREPAENSCRPAVDVLFRSAAAVFGPRVLGIVLTGMGSDGLRGCESIREAGGQVIVQDEASSVVWGMPGFVAHAGLANRVLPLEEVADEIVDRVGMGRRLYRFERRAGER